MSGPVLVPCLVKLRSELNSLCPARGKASDGWIGDTAHQATTSDHNDDETGRVPIRDADTVHEVHAVDVDKDLYTPGLNMERVVQHILTRCRSGAEARLRYVIYNRRIWAASSGWAQQPYSGPSPHTEHAHFSASYSSSLEANVSSWRLADLVPRKVAAVEFAVSMPLLREGDDDADRPGYDTIRKIQRQAGVEPDGVWGTVTSTALGYREMNEDRYRSLFGLSRA